jgi:starch phosphorylase
VTNGVHTPSWDSAAADKLWTKACGKDRWLGTTEALSKSIRGVCDADLWHFRTDASHKFVDYVREHFALQLLASGASSTLAEEARHLFDPNVLTIGFARRFASYKRPNLLLHNPARLQRLLTNPERPVQLIIAGKAHPADQAGQDMIKQWVQYIRQPQIRQHAIFLSDHDMLLSEHLVAGVDVWLNTPQRPWEASGTSGMKVLVNGGINLSELDGWWAEAYSPDIGWALGDGKEHGNDPALNAIEAEALYDLLEQQVIPEFYDRDVKGIPVAWMARMRESMARLTPRFSTNRVVREYTEQRYLPAAESYRTRADNNAKVAAQIAGWQQKIEQCWPRLRFDGAIAKDEGELYYFAVNVFLAGLKPSDVNVEIYANALVGGKILRQTLDCEHKPEDSMGAYFYCTKVPAQQSLSDYTLRITPRHVGVTLPLELNYILWNG